MLVERHRAQCVQVEPRIGYFLSKVTGAIFRPAAVPARQPAQPELAVEEESEPQSRGVLRHEEEVGCLHVELLEQPRADHRQQVDPGQRHPARGHHLLPARDQIGIGESREQVAVVAPLAGLAAERCRGHVRRVAIMLPELAAHHVRAVAAERMRQGLEAIILLDGIHHDVRGKVGQPVEVFLEVCLATFVVGEGQAFGDLAAAPVRRGHGRSRDADEELVSHSSPANRELQMLGCRQPRGTGSPSQNPFYDNYSTR